MGASLILSTTSCLKKMDIGQKILKYGKTPYIYTRTYTYICMYVLVPHPEPQGATAARVSSPLQSLCTYKSLQ